MDFKRRAFSMRVHNQTAVETIKKILCDVTIPDHVLIRQIRGVIAGLTEELKRKISKEAYPYEQ